MGGRPARTQRLSSTPRPPPSTTRVTGSSGALPHRRRHRPADPVWREDFQGAAAADAPAEELDRHTRPASSFLCGICPPPTQPVATTGGRFGPFDSVVGEMNAAFDAGDVAIYARPRARSRRSCATREPQTGRATASRSIAETGWPDAHRGWSSDRLCKAHVGRAATDVLVMKPTEDGFMLTFSVRST